MSGCSSVARGMLARGVGLAAMVSTVAAGGAAAFAQAADADAAGKYPVSLTNGFVVDRGSSDLLEYCVLRGFRAMPRAGTETGTLSVFTEIVFDEEGNAYSRGMIAVDVKETSFTNQHNRPVQVRIELDGRAYDMTQGNVQQDVLTLLEFRFPAELLEKVAAAKTMKIYTVDVTTKAQTLFATADISAGQADFAEHAKCTRSLPELPSQLSDGWELRRDDGSCLITPMMNSTFGATVLAKDKRVAMLFFVEQRGPYPFSKPGMEIAGRAVVTGYSLTTGDDGYHHGFAIDVKDLDRFQPGAELEITDDDAMVYGGKDMYSMTAVTYLKKCAATLKPADKAS